MKIRTVSHFFLKSFIQIPPASERVEFSDEKCQKKKSQLALLIWAVYNHPSSNRFILIYTSEDHTSPYNYSHVMSLFFICYFPQTRVLKVIELQDTAFPYLDV